MREPAQALARGFGWAAFAGAGLVITFWALYLTGLLAPARDTELIRRYEAAFLAADAVLAAALLGASRALFRRRPLGPFLLAAGAGTCVYLGLVDLAFYLQAGLYTPPGGPALVALAVNALCIGGGAAGLWGGWALWRSR